jgi:hypothetical protein
MEIMRRHVFLLIAIAALVAAVALLRPRQALQVDVEVAAAKHIDELIHDIVQVEDDVAAPAPVPAPRIMVTKETLYKPASAPGPAMPPNLLSVVDPHGVPVPEAVVFQVTHSYGNRSDAKIREWRTDDNGELKVVLGPYDRSHFISYRLGVGSGMTGELRAGVDATLKYEKNLTVAVKCVAPHGVDLESAEVVLTTEITFGEQRDRYGKVSPIVVPLPPRTLLTDREGICTFRTVLAPRQIRTVWPPIPGIRHTLQAAWHTMSARETLEKPIEGTVTLTLSQ